MGLTLDSLRLPKDAEIVILTGAGISQESGLATFRDLGGLWEQVRLEEVATPEAYARDPDRVLAFYNARRAQLRQPQVQPNPAHLALARLEREWPGRVLLVTQNVDDLHERGGSPSPLHMHGELLKRRCTGCGQVDHWADDITRADACPACNRVGTLRPHIVWFGEMPEHLEAIGAALEAADLFISIGTSGTVWPAAGFCAEARAAGAFCLNLSLDPAPGPFDQTLLGKAGETVPALVSRLLGS